MMTRRKICKPVSREQLLQVMENTYDDARFLVGITTQEEGDFRNGLCRYRNEFWSKEQLLKAIADSPLNDFCFMCGYEGYLVVSRHLFVSRDSINYAQIFSETENVGGFHYVNYKGYPHYDIYFKIDHDAQIITFALGKKRRTLPLKEDSEWAWKLTPTCLLTRSSEILERNFLDDFWNGIAVRLGRKALGIQEVV